MVDSLAHSEGELSKLLCGLVQGFIDIAVDEFPKTVAHLSCAELQFIAKVQQRKIIFLKSWYKQYQADMPKEDWMDDVEIKSLGAYLHNALQFGWMHSNSEKPDVVIPEKSLIGKYARRVLNYVSVGRFIVCLRRRQLPRVNE